MCCIYSLIICETFMHRKVLKISVNVLSSLFVRNVRVHGTSKNQCTCFCSLPATYTLHTTCFMIPIFLGVLQRACDRTLFNKPRIYEPTHLILSYDKQRIILVTFPVSNNPLYYYYFVCHPTMCSMSSNVDHS